MTTPDLPARARRLARTIRRLPGVQPGSLMRTAADLLADLAAEVRRLRKESVAVDVRELSAAELLSVGLSMLVCARDRGDEAVRHAWAEPDPTVSAAYVVAALCESLGVRGAGLWGAVNAALAVREGRELPAAPCRCRGRDG